LRRNRNTNKENTVPAEGEPESHLVTEFPTAKKAPKGTFAWLSSLLRPSLLRMRDSEGSYKEALQEVLDDHAEEFTHSPEEGRILSNILDFGEMNVSDIMTPQTDIVAVEASATLEQLYEIMVREQHTRIPVYEERLDKITGFVHVKDMLPWLGGKRKDFSIQQISRNILFIPTSMKLSDLLLKMRVSGVHIAIVVDEYGGTNGLVTLEDLFEEIVGDIQDEHDEALQAIPLQWDARGSLVVDARIAVEELQEKLGIMLSDEEEEEDYDTLGGLIFSLLGRVPVKGESTLHPSGVRIEILDVDARRIKRVRLIRPSSLNGQ
jgi:CBS domain containing-hemolysin-like protein